MWRSFLLQSCVFLVILGVASIPVMWTASRLWGRSECFAAGIAAGVCACGGLLALGAAWIARRVAPNPLVEAFVAMFVRFGVVGGAALLYAVLSGQFGETHFLIYLAVFYFVTLWLDVLLIVLTCNAGPRGGAEPTPNASEIQEKNDRMRDSA